MVQEVKMIYCDSIKLVHQMPNIRARQTIQIVHMAEHILR
jgi:hypothetical protein